MISGLRPSLLLLGAAFGTAAVAQQLPSAGGQLQQLPPAPAPRVGTPDISVERPGSRTGPLDTGPAFPVAALRITGQTLFDEPTLLAATGFAPNANLSLGDLQAMAARITAFYSARGYFVAQAYVPAQSLAGGTVTIAVIEGRYGKVGVANSSGVADRVVRQRLAGLDAGDVVANAPLERRLLLLSDLPGVAVKSTLSPGTDVGTSDLAVDVLPGRRVFGSVEADNGGNRYTGYFRAGGQINLANPLGIGDVVSVRGLVSDRGLTYVRGAYQAPLGAATIGVAYARLDYRLHREFESLDASGSADIASVFASYPAIRSYNYNLNLLAGLDYKMFNDRVASVGASSNKHSTVGFLGLSGDWRDSLGGGGSGFYSAIVSIGSLDIRTPAVLALDAQTGRTQGGFTKLNLAAGRLQTLSGPLSLYLAARGQIASKNLDISEKMQLGGAYGVRAYPEGEAFGDQGYIATAELRLLLGALSRSVPGDVQLFGFIDNGGITFNRNRYAAGVNSANLTGGGGGISWSAPNNFLVRASYARRLGNTPVMSQPDKMGQIWVQITKLF
ncbi:ShlB/FhaC/HecB family hemolysin secretion/activation protein [Polymorphobacter fuscus]|uniref:ShlB/FhaC/HecB family hemolysin secretion/activation protein n=1 Tax=Sandarakinorhabdus fusca TaxID=1439888 RepID=UPI0016931B18|nr:ShlB/FhaC/HecB family hemolysin secretion/activation protein [Polymorphobacter fuscus]NJC10007.1 hemolysin activation/secretion protein [Polymorphobacter fuscus]